MILSTILALIIFNAPIAHADTNAPLLSLDDFIVQVEKNNGNYQSSVASSMAGDLKLSEANLVYSPTLTTYAQTIHDYSRQPLFPSLYSRYLDDEYNIGVSQATPIGLEGSLSYDLQHYNYVGLMDPFWIGIPKIQLSMPILGRNFWGEETRSQFTAAEASAQAQKYSQSFAFKSTRASAEVNYIQLAAARELKNVSQAALQTAQELYEHFDRQFKHSLAETSDLYQAEANLEARKLALEQADDQERTAARSLNLARGVDSDAVSESLMLPEVTELQAPARAELRDDTRAAREQERAASAQAEAAKQKDTYALELYGQYALNSRDLQETTAIQDSFESQMPTFAIGIKLTAPLAFGSANRARQGYQQDEVAASLASDRKLIEQESEWKELVHQLDEAKRRYTLALTLEKIQKKKSDNEQVRLAQGRTTTYQRLTFETDYITAEAGRIQAQSDVLTVLAQMKTFSP